MKIPDIKQTMSPAEVEQDIHRKLKAFNSPNKIEGTEENLYAIYGFAGYEKYDLWAISDYQFLLWKPENDQQIIKPNFKWNGIFEEKPYISYEADSGGYTFIQAPAIVKRDAERFRTNRQQRYQEFIKAFSPDTSNPLKLLADIQGLHSMLEQQAARQIKQLETIDKDLISLLKVFYYEAEKSILPNGTSDAQPEQIEKLLNFIQDTRHLYQWGIRTIASTEKLLKHWIPKRIERSLVPAPVGQSLINGIKALMPKKEPILNSMIPVIEKLIHIETLKYYALNDQPVLDDSRELPELIDKSIQAAIKQAIYGKNHSYEAKQFLNQYAPLHKENPKIEKKDAIEQIRKKVPEITVDNRTLYTWINHYLDALNSL